ncbi:histidine phosphatase family protein, partial [Tyzzerella sp. OttesenSCG-928-J15]|nr:histidine phosphatase family protein [Tyzzerella sp. OttesenSCG-928-J15]
FEIAEKVYLDNLPEISELTYPAIQPHLHEKVCSWLKQNISTVYMVRHAKPDYSIKEDALRPLTEDGVKASLKLVDLFENIHIDAAFSSPYIRAVNTIKPLCDGRNILIKPVEDFKERVKGTGWVENFDTYFANQWNDFDFKIENGESFREVQNRNVAALNKVTSANKGKTIIIGTHGFALSTLLNFYDKSFGIEASQRLITFLPYIIKLELIDNSLINSQELFL